jgi:dihydrofolate reductase
MTMICSVYIAASLDGFIARPDGDIEWLHNSAYNLPEGENDFGYERFINTVDALVMGRHTYEKVLSFDGWPYGEKKVVVLTGRPLSIPAAPTANVSFDSGSPADIVTRLDSAGAGHLYIDGGQTIQQFLQAGLISQMIITQIPILLGSGIPLFGSLATEISLNHRQTRTFANGFVQSHYEIMKNQD